jgi:hypothetical protein
MFTRPPAGTGLTPLRAALLTLVAEIACALAISACHASRPSPPDSTRSATVSTPSPVAPSTSSTHTYTYKSKQQGCDLLDLRALSAALGNDAGPLEHPHYEETAVAYFARCDRQYGPPGARSLVSIQIMVVKSGTAQFLYDGMRAGDAKATTISDTPGLAAQGAYTWTDPQTGPHLTMYDGNLYLRISISQIVRQGPSAATVTELMTAIARNSMSAMAA